MTGEKFAFRQGHSINGVNPQLIGETLETIRTEKGKLVAEDVVEQARSDDSPLHAAFEWDDSAAAHQHRLQQARKLIVSIRIVSGPVQAPVPVYVSVRSHEVGRSYVPTSQALTDEELRVKVLTEIKDHLDSIRRKYAHFTEAIDVIDRISRNVG